MWRLSGIWLGGLILTGTTALAHDPPQEPACAAVVTEDATPKQTVLQVTRHTTGNIISLTREDLRALPTAALTTSTVVTDGTHDFRGFLMRDLLEQMDVKGSHVTATALNDYAVDIPLEDFYRFDVIVACRMDGKRLRRADKGPLWIVYPRDDHEALQDIRYDYRWVWQLHRLDAQ